MHIWVDADACPKVIKEILFRAAERDGIVMTLVANQAMVRGGLAKLDMPLSGKSATRNALRWA